MVPSVRRVGADAGQNRLLPQVPAGYRHGTGSCFRSVGSSATRLRYGYDSGFRRSPGGGQYEVGGGVGGTREAADDLLMHALADEVPRHRRAGSRRRPPSPPFVPTDRLRQVIESSSPAQATPGDPSAVVTGDRLLQERKAPE